MVLDVQNVTMHNAQHKKDAVKNVSFQVRGGEIVCLAGIEGNGQTEFVYGLTGLEKFNSGKVLLDGKEITNESIRQRSKDGMSHIPEDRHKHGLVLDYSLENNMVLQRYWQPEFQHNGFIRSEKVREYSDKLIAQYDVRSGQGSATIVRSMSGGNQQKAIIAREIDKDPKLLVAVQPTRGLDVGAIEYIHKQIVDERDRGKAVLLVSLELDEVMNLSDRILVMYEGEIVGEFDPKTTTVQELGLYMAGARKQGKGKAEMKNKKLSHNGLQGSVTSVMAALLCILIGLFVGFLVLLAINPAHAWADGFVRILKGGFHDAPYGVGKELANAAPLIMTGLSVGFAFKTGLFNIGAAGQYTLGAYGALYCAIMLKLPWFVCLLAAAILGGLWGAIPGFFKAYFNINEVITSIMFNWIGLYLVNELVYQNGTGPMYDVRNTRTLNLGKNADLAQSVIPDFGLNKLFQTNSTTIAIFLAAVVAILIWVVLNKTTFGYELKAVGLNKSAARYAGINEKKNIILSMAIAGALAGFGAGLFYLSNVGQWNPLNSTSLPAMGFNGISVALLASSNPIGTIFSALFISHISVGGTFLSTKYYPTEIADLISGIIIYLCAFSMLFRGKIQKLLFKNADKTNVNAEPAPAKPETKKEGK